MRSPIDESRGKIVDVKQDGTVLIEAKCQDIDLLIKREYKEANVQFIDSRKLSDKQRNACHALMREIADYTGMNEGLTKDYMKLKFLVDNFEDTNGDMFSLADAPMSLVCAFQRFLVKFILEFDVPTSFPLVAFVDDIQDYVYNCLMNKKCCVCGLKADLHHCEGSRVGMGNDREEIVHEGLEVLPLCRVHHNEAHEAGEIEFFKKYHLEAGIKADKDVCRVYKLKAKKENKDAESH